MQYPEIEAEKPPSANVNFSDPPYLPFSAGVSAKKPITLEKNSLGDNTIKTLEYLRA
jgi:hypothetical protein